MAIDAFLRALSPGLLRIQTQMQTCQMLAQATDFATHYEKAEQESGLNKKPIATLVAVKTEPAPAPPATVNATPAIAGPPQNSVKTLTARREIPPEDPPGISWEP